MIRGMPLDPAFISEVAERAARAASGPARVMVFGSYARGDAGDDSDLDLIVLEPSFANKVDEYLRSRTAIGALGVGVDLLLFTEEEFERRSSVPGCLPYWAKREGKLLHERTA